MHEMMIDFDWTCCQEATASMIWLNLLYWLFFWQKCEHSPQILCFSEIVIHYRYSCQFSFTSKGFAICNCLKGCLQALCEINWGLVQQFWKYLNFLSMHILLVFYGIWPCLFLLSHMLIFFHSNGLNYFELL